MPEITAPLCAVIGSGPAGLMAAEMLASNGFQVHVFDAKPSLGRKFLMAGKSGLNITKSQPIDDFVGHYVSDNAMFRAGLKDLTPKDVVQWCEGLGQDTFIGSSARVFPKAMKASPLLRAWLERLSSLGVVFQTKHRWTGFDGDDLCFDTPEGQKRVHAAATVFALGGKSWSRLGSDGLWVAPFQNLGIEIVKFRPSNCGFDCAWDSHFSERFAGVPVKNVALSVGGSRVRGDFVITASGVEGGIVYIQSAAICEAVEHKRGGVLLDLMPDVTHEKLVSAFGRDQGKNSFSNHARKVARLKGAKLGLLRMCAPSLNQKDAADIASHLKQLPLPVTGPRPIDEAISVAGGVSMRELDDNFMLTKRSGTFLAGEMLDWDAPTGGYLITACLSTGKQAGEGACRWLSAAR